MTSEQATAIPGVLFERDGARIVDTRELPWEGNDAFIASSLRKSLAFDEVGEAIVYKRVLPTTSGKRTKGYHLAPEFNFFLNGELPYGEYLPDGTPLVVTFQRGSWLDRPAGSMHGGSGVKHKEPVYTLDWMLEHRSQFVGLSELAGLTEPLPLPGESAAGSSAMQFPEAASSGAQDGVRWHDPGGALIIDSRVQTWTPHPLFPASGHKVLSVNDEGDPVVILWALPPGQFPAAALPYRVRHRYRSFAYVFEGELEIVLYDSPEDERGESILLRRDCFIDLRPGTIYGFPATPVSRTGATLVRWNTRPEAHFIGEDVRHRDWTRNMTPGLSTVSPFATPEDRDEDLRRMGITLPH